MVSISRPAPIAQEAGVKYFFLGAMAAAILLLGLAIFTAPPGRRASTSSPITWPPCTTRLGSAYNLPNTNLPVYLLLGVVLLICGLCFKIAAVPLQMYAADVYQGAATPVTAFLSFVPKTAGFVALIKPLVHARLPAEMLSPTLVKLLWILAVLTMFFGNILGLMQTNVKRVLAYSLHRPQRLHAGGPDGPGGRAQFPAAHPGDRRNFVLSAGLWTGQHRCFCGFDSAPVSLRPPGRAEHAAGLADSAETFADLAGQGRRHVGLGLVMALACFSLIGIPATFGFLGKSC